MFGFNLHNTSALNAVSTAGGRIGERLIKKGVVPRAAVERAVAIQYGESPQARRRLGDILIQEFGVERHTVYRELAEMYAFREVDLSNSALKESDHTVIKQLFSSLPQDLQDRVRQHILLPYKAQTEHGAVLCIAAADPTCPDIPIIASALGSPRYEVQYCRLEILKELLERLLPAPNEFLQDYENVVETEDTPSAEEAEINEKELDAEIYRSRLTNLIEGCFVEAVRTGASDIHFIPKTGSQVEIYFRIDGKLYLWSTQTGTRAESVAAVLKDRSKNVDRFERDTAQDGFFQRTIDNTIIRFRVSILPIIGAAYERKLESVVVRILDDRKVITDFEQLGLLSAARHDFLKAISKPQGIVILTGPTGSGKSTTLMAALSKVMKPELNVLTVEEPVEYLILGARQLKINPKMDFDQAMRSILRHDPDIVMVGEMRDKKTAEIAFKLANTGHLTFSTLHTNDAFSVISRLYKMGVEPFLIAYAVNIVIAQRLVRRLCPVCKTADTNIDTGIPEALGFTHDEIQNMVFYKPAGCSKCRGGYSGRIAIHETLLFTRDIRRAILGMHGDIDEELIKSIGLKNGMLTLRASGRERIKLGETTCEEVAFATANDE